VKTKPKFAPRDDKKSIEDWNRWGEENKSHFQRLAERNPTPAPAPKLKKKLVKRK
jgi:hypothetical protein